MTPANVLPVEEGDIVFDMYVRHPAASLLNLEQSLTEADS